LIWWRYGAGAQAGTGITQKRRRDVSKKVLIVDDEPNIVLSLEYLMRREGFEVAVANDGEAALEKVSEFHPDLMLLDVVMPRKTGFEVCEALRSKPDLGELKIVMLSAKGRESDIAKGTGLGADAYIIKPFSTKDLVAKVKSLLVSA
jgi:DNA-binding response OmpR family regulator